MIFFSPDGGRNDALRDHLAKAGIIIGGGASGPIRLVLHKDVGDTDLDRVVSKCRDFFG